LRLVQLRQARADVLLGFFFTQAEDLKVLEVLLAVALDKLARQDAVVALVLVLFLMLFLLLLLLLLLFLLVLLVRVLLTVVKCPGERPGQCCAHSRGTKSVDGCGLAPRFLVLSKAQVQDVRGFECVMCALRTSESRRLRQDGRESFARSTIGDSTGNSGRFCTRIGTRIGTCCTC
jgi:hypothetical protein